MSICNVILGLLVFHPLSNSYVGGQQSQQRCDCQSDIDNLHALIERLNNTVANAFSKYIITKFIQSVLIIPKRNFKIYANVLLAQPFI
jgi:hypothetical protein